MRRRFFQHYFHAYNSGSGGERGWALYRDGGDGGELYGSGVERSAGRDADVRVELRGQRNGDGRESDAHLRGGWDLHCVADGDEHEQFDGDSDEQGNDCGGAIASGGQCGWALYGNGGNGGEL